MEKKIYTTPALSVEEYEMIIITDASIQEIGGNAGFKNGGSDEVYRAQGGSVRANSRDGGIWDED